MRCSNCGKCCEKTEMELSSKDVERLEETGYLREEFTVIERCDRLSLMGKERTVPMGIRCR